jgi:uncharacterized damage-inducible protein DinB
MLRAFLEYHRATLAVKCDGLAPQRLKERSVPPSSLCLLGLVRHMAEVERSWFRRTLAGEDAPPLYYSDDDLDGDFDNVDDADPAEAMAVWQQQCEQARQVEAGFASLDDWQRGGSSAQRPPVTLRWVLVHMIEEYARHNGHADLLRERLDGVTGE